jgi:pimeloyl-ACP methyl ester carboxylesterase
MRACRSSPGHFSIEGWVRDARSIVEAARALEGAEGLRVAVVGSSAGGAVAVQAVARGAPVDALVLLAAPAAWLSFAGSPAEAVRRITVEAGMALAPGVDGAPDRWAAEFETVVPEDAIGELSIPTLIVHGTADEVVPVDHAHRLAERAPGAELQVIEGAPHTLRRHPGVFELVESWIGGTLS